MERDSTYIPCYRNVEVLKLLPSCVLCSYQNIHQIHTQLSVLGTHLLCTPASIGKQNSSCPYQLFQILDVILDILSCTSPACYESPCLGIKTRLRGGIIIKKRENCELFPKWGGGTPPKKSEIQIRTFENPWGGVSIFQKCLNYKLL